MMHQNAKKKLNCKPAHKKALMRNQVIHLITYGHLVSTKVRVKEVQRLAEKLVTIARAGNEFNVRRRVMALLPYKEEAIIKLLVEIAPKYVSRPGGYTRVIPMGRRMSDTATVARLEWV
ncbi:50S ribosomal protein L17 [Candidatus Dependentiae bacterium HGW-Dependentiae-1]|nr:MAG: 50S ribosomal protein L17 [Candidatus Dependentiae bacterium HGW-Dependentiae-1]